MTATKKAVLVGDAIGQRIVRAATDSFMHDGYAGTSTAAIAREAKTSKRALYERFPNKEALFEHVMHEICSRASASRAPLATDTEPTLEATLRWYGLAVVERFLMPETRSVFIAAVSAIPDAPRIIEIFWNEGPGQAAGVIARALAAARKRGETRALRPQQEARWFIFECSGAVVLGQLFDANVRMQPKQIGEYVDAVVGRALNRWGA